MGARHLEEVGALGEGDCADLHLRPVVVGGRPGFHKALRRDVRPDRVEDVVRDRIDVHVALAPDLKTC